MRLLGLLLLALIAGCASNPRSNFEEIGLRVGGDPRPNCEPGHESSLSDGTITIRPGQIICVTVKVQGNSVVPLSVVSSEEPGKTVILKFWQEPSSNDMVLTVHNPLATFLRYRAYMLRPGASRREYTTSCPVLSERFGLEHWPHAISQVTLANFESLPESETITCH